MWSIKDRAYGITLPVHYSPKSLFIGLKESDFKRPWKKLFQSHAASNILSFEDIDGHVTFSVLMSVRKRLLSEHYRTLAAAQ